jgi:hypothetical protein
MRIALLNTKDTHRARYILECFREGAASHGDECFWVQDTGDMALLERADVGVQVCAANRHASDPLGKFRSDAEARMKDLGKRLLIVDTGFVKSQYDHEMALATGVRVAPFDVKKPETFKAVDTLVYYELGYDGIKGLADHCNRGVGPDRWNVLRRPIRPWQTRGRHVLVLGQPLHGQSSQGVDIFDWYAKTLAAVRKATRKPIVIRQHPRLFKHGKGANVRRSPEADRESILARLPKHLRAEVQWARFGRLEVDLREAWAAVVFSSNAAVGAVLDGVPVFAGSPACVAYPVANHLMSNIERPAYPDRSAWAYALAYAQWNCHELRAGTAWTRYRPHALAPAVKEAT